MPTPRKSKRFGGSGAHQRLMMANLCASLFAAEASASPGVIEPSVSTSSTSRS